MRLQHPKKFLNLVAIEKLAELYHEGHRLAIKNGNLYKLPQRPLLAEKRV
jgi:hypothetical protein